MTALDFRPNNVGVAPRGDLVSMSGADFLRAMCAGLVPHSSMAGTGNFRLIHAEEGRVVLEGAPTQEHLNPMATTHGGWFGMILDTALGCAVMSRLAAGTVYTTLEYKVNLLRGIPPGTHVIATGTSAHAGRSTGVATAELHGATDGRLYATASTTCLVMTAPVTPSR